jgi:hypothetical protein
MQKEDSIKYKMTHINENTNLLSDYIQFNLLAFQYLRNRNYNSAKKSFKECINIAKQFNEFDESKHLESLVNYAISQYFCGKFIDAYSSLERAFQMSSRIISSIIKDQKFLK